MIRRPFLYGLAAAVLTLICQRPVAAEQSPPPRLIVVVAIDQFPQRYLQEMRPGFRPTGVFERLLKKGAQFTECRHRHAFTLTGPGHSVLLTGAYPNLTGVVGNEWFNRELGRDVNCVEDSGAPLVGISSDEPSSGRSPRNQLSPTVGDVMKLATEGQARVFGIALKDRSAILMAGHLADAAFWFDEDTGRWVTSRYYREQLPDYLEQANNDEIYQKWADQEWDLLYPPEKYRHFRPDDSPHESLIPLGREFPHHIPSAIESLYHESLPYTPFANDMTLDVAQRVIEHEELGQDDVPDLLVVGLSANDYVGHLFGPYSLEVQDVTYRTDVALGEFAQYLDQRLGSQWTLVITSDHGIGPIPEYAAQLGLPAVRNPLGPLDQLKQTLEETLRAELGAPPLDLSYVQHVSDNMIYLNNHALRPGGDRHLTAQRLIQSKLLENPAVAGCLTRQQLLFGAGSRAGARTSLSQQLALNFHAGRSGDVLFVLQPYHMHAQQLRTTHGSPWDYDSHVVLLFGGAGIRPGTYHVPASPAQIAPTLCRLLGIEDPPACVVEPLSKAIHAMDD